MDWITVPATFFVIFGFIYKFAELFVRKRERMMVVNKILSSPDFDPAKLRLNYGGGRFSALRVGWCALGIGMGLLLGFLINMMATFGDYAMNTNRMFDYRIEIAGIVYVSCICICGGMGLLLSYRMERKADSEPKAEQEF